MPLKLCNKKFFLSKLTYQQTQIVKKRKRSTNEDDRNFAHTKHFFSY